MNEVRLGILHLTDLHAGQPKHDIEYPTMRTAFRADLERCHTDSGPWDIIIFSGDLSFSGNKRQFEEVEKFVNDVQSKLRTLGSRDAVFLAVPGNHDLQWASAIASDAVVLGKLANMPEEEADPLWSEIFHNHTSSYRQTIDTMFKEYSDWWAPWARKARRKFGKFRPGLLPGEFAAIFDKEGRQFAVVGLNATFLQVSKGNFAKRLAVRPEQLLHLAPPNDPDWLERVDAALLVTHQPPSWFSPTNREHSFEPHIDRSGRFALHLCGHEHVGATSLESRGLSPPRRLALGRSLLALEPAEDKSERLYGYQAIRITIPDNSDEGSFQIWPRSAVKNQSNDWEFGPDRSYYQGDDDGVSQLPPQFRFQRPNRKLRPSSPSTSSTPLTDPLRLTAEQRLATDVRIKIEGLLISDPFIETGEIQDNKPARGLFIEPSIRTESDEARLFEFWVDNTIRKSIPLSEILNSDENYLITAAKDGGKTTLARLLAYDLNDVSDSGRTSIGIYLNFNDDLPGDPPSVTRAVQIFLRPNRAGADIERLLAEGKITLIFDDFSVSPRKLDAFISFSKRYPRVRYILIADEVGLERLGVSSELDVGVSFKRAYLQNFTRKEVEALLVQRYGITGRRIRETSIRIFQVLLQMRVRPNPLAIILIINLLFDKADISVSNTALLLEDYVNHFIRDTNISDIRHRQRMHFLSWFSEHLARKNSTSITDSEFETAIMTYLDTHGISESIRDFGNCVIDTRILIEETSTERKVIKFAHECFRQFFGGMRSLLNKRFLDFCASEENFLRFGHELVIATGKSEGREDLLSIVEERVIRYRDRVGLRLTADVVDAVMSDAVGSELINGLSPQLQALRDSAKERERVLGDAVQSVPDSVPMIDDEAAVILEEDAVILEEDSDARGSSSVDAFRYIESLYLLIRLLQNSEMSEFDAKRNATQVIMEESARLIVYLIVNIQASAETPEKNEFRSASDINGDSQRESNLYFVDGDTSQDDENLKNYSNNNDKILATLKIMLPNMLMNAVSDGCSSSNMKKSFESFVNNSDNILAKLLCASIGSRNFPNIFLPEILRICRSWKSAVLARRIILPFLRVQLAVQERDLEVQRHFVETLLGLEEIDNSGFISSRNAERNIWRTGKRVEIEKQIERMRIAIKG